MRPKSINSTAIGKQALPPRVLRIITRLNVGGPARHVAWLTAGLGNAGFESHLVAGIVPPGEDELDEFIRAEGVVPVTIREMSREISWKDVLVIWKLYRLFCRLHPDIVHTHTAKAGTVGRLAGLLYRWLTPWSLVGRPRSCRFVHTYHGHVFRGYYGAMKTRFILAVERLLARFATDRVVVISRQQYDEIHHHFRVGRAEQFTVIPLGLDMSTFDGWQQRRAILRSELGADETEILVGIVGRLTPVKNHMQFLLGASEYQKLHAAASGRRVRFVIVGNGPLRSSLEKQVRALGLQDNVAFLGLRTDPENIYPGLDIVALTSLNEGTPLSLIEAMANARPVIATAVGGVPDLLGAPVPPGSSVADYQASYRVCERGISLPPSYPLAFNYGLTKLIEDENLRRELGERGRSFVEQSYTKERLVRDMARLYGEFSESPDPAAEGSRHAAEKPSFSPNPATLRGSDTVPRTVRTDQAG